MDGKLFKTGNIQCIHIVHAFALNNPLLFEVQLYFLSVGQTSQNSCIYFFIYICILLFIGTLVTLVAYRM